MSIVFICSVYVMARSDSNSIKKSRSNVNLDQKYSLYLIKSSKESLYFGKSCHARIEYLECTHRKVDRVVLLMAETPIAERTPHKNEERHVICLDSSSPVYEPKVVIQWKNQTMRPPWTPEGEAGDRCAH